MEYRNLLSARKNPSNVTTLIQLELQKGYITGPFSSPPFPVYRVSPIGIVESKYSKKKRLIIDLSAPHDDPDQSSINELIDKDTFSLSYVKLDDAIRSIQEKGQGALLCKTDITDAFKLIPCHPSLYHLYMIKWQGQYFFFNRLTFGCRSSRKIFDHLSQSVAWIAHNNSGIDCLLYLLDDFLTIDHPDTDATTTMASLMDFFKKLGIPIAAHKTVGPTTVLEFLGIILDTLRMEARLPQEKLDRIRAFLNSMLHRKTCTKREMLQLLGHLNFACRVIRPGRSFISRIIDASKGVNKLHHHVHIDRDCKADLLTWHTLLQQWNGVSLFLDPNFTSTADLNLYTDASGLGYGGYCKGMWFQGKWNEYSAQFGEGEHSIAYKELYPIVVASILWSPGWSRKKILFHCDNMTTVDILKKGRSKSPALMSLIRRLVICAATNNFDFSAVHIPGLNNSIADALSRFQMDRFRALAPEADASPCQVPPDVLLH